jgi:predicted CxxxxCH...CXXCH cytochrome family protein
VPATDSHTKHLSGLAVNFSRNALCADCHTGYVQSSSAPANHRDGNIDVNVGSYPAKLVGSSLAACTTAYCHSNGAAGFKSATWGTPNTAGCNFCHDALPVTGSHTIHIGGTANYSFGCAECHGHNGIGTAHNNGTLEIVGSIGYNGTSKLCSTSDCHSDGKATPAYKTTPTWLAGTFAGDRCAACHGNWPTGDAHAAHAVGIHYNDVSNLSGGKIAASATVASGTNAAHGNALYSTTISCNICHANTVSVSYNDNASTCNTAACHASGGSGGSKGSLTSASLNKTFHVNRARDVSFADATVRSKAQVRNDITTVPELNNFWSRTNDYKAGASSHDASKTTLLVTADYDTGSGTCSTVACHNGNAISWTSGAISCDKSHTALP